MSFYSQFSEYYERIFPFRQQTYSFLRQFLPETNGRVIDIGCGTGHYAGKFAREGAHAVGIDLNEEIIAYAQYHYPEAHFFCLDMQQVEAISERFDLIYSIGNVVSHLSKMQLEDFVKRTHERLAPGGIWIFQTVNWDHILEEKRAEFPIREFEDGRVRFLRKYLQISEQRITFRTTLESDGERVFDECTNLYPYSRKEMLSLHSKSGFECIAHYGDYHKIPYQEASSSASIFVFQKSSSEEG